MTFKDGICKCGHLKSEHYNTYPNLPNEKDFGACSICDCKKFTLKYDDIRIRKVKVLSGSLLEIAYNKGLKDNDLVIVRTSLEKIEGSPIEYLQRTMLEESK